MSNLQGRPYVLGFDSVFVPTQAMGGGGCCVFTVCPVVPMSVPCQQRRRHHMTAHGLQLSILCLKKRANFGKL